VNRYLAAVLLATALPFVAVLVLDPGDPIGLPAVDGPVPGDSDVYEMAWHFWWVGDALSSGQDPRFCGIIGEPPGASLVSQNVGWPDAVVFGPAASRSASFALNLSLLANALFACFGGWLLARSWGLGGSSCAFAGFLCAWAPPRVAHSLQHYQIAAIGLVLISLALARLLLRGGKPRLAILLAASTALAGMESPYHTLLLLPGISAVTLLSLPATWRRIGLVAGATVVGTAAALVFYGAFPGGVPPLSTGYEDAVYWSADAAGFFLPGPFGLLGTISRMPVTAGFMPNPFEGVVTPGIAVLSLLFVSLSRKKGRLLLLAGAAFCILALGPQLKLFGTRTGIPLPCGLLFSLPFADGARSSARFAIAAVVFFSLPAAMAFGGFPRKLKAAALAAVALELYMPVLPSLPGIIPSAYRNGGTVSPVLEIPSSPIARRYIYFQTADGASRPVFFSARGAHEMPPGLEVFAEGSTVEPSREDVISAGLGCVAYNRWMFEGRELARYDSLYSGIFGPGMADSVEIWIAP
jgi:hypothetical protein